MVRIDIVGWSGDAVGAVAAVASSLNLEVATDGELRSFPGSRHWHFRRRERSGTLEVTLWPSENGLWVSYHENRVGDGWVVAACDEFACALAAKLSGSTEG